MRLVDSEDRDLSDKESSVALLALARVVLYMVALAVVI
jgi:hypothetical protein